ncbi:MAG TPA: agmatinase [Clostridia bacterium]|nr:agmatinase [Clostridia bacterium]
MDGLSLPRFMGCDADIEDAGVVIFGAGFDGTVTFRPGSRFAPAAMRMEFYGLETYSPVLDRDLADIRVCDGGDLELPFGNTATALEMIRHTAADIIGAGKKPLMIGGEHLVTLPAFEAALKKYPDICLVHLDAHTDLREEYLGERLTHSGVVRRAWDLVGDGRIWQLGIRSGMKEEFTWAGEGHTFLRPYDLSAAREAVSALSGRPVYLTIDLDVLDPSVMPGTGTPEPGGVTYKELEKALLCFRELDIVAADVVELAPRLDNSGISTAAACKVMREVLLLMG